MSSSSVEAQFDRSDEYKRYIRSESWRAKRSQYFAAYGGDCKGCGEERGHIHVHHKTYERLGDELLTDLVSVCQACHVLIHERHQLGGVTLADATDLILVRVREHKQRFLDERQSATKKITNPRRTEPNTESRRYRRRYASAAAASVRGCRREVTPSVSWKERNDAYALLRRREEQRRRTA